MGAWPGIFTHFCPCPPWDNHEPCELWAPNPHLYNEFFLSTTVLF